MRTNVSQAGSLTAHLNRLSLLVNSKSRKSQGRHETPPSEPDMMRIEPYAFRFEKIQIYWILADHGGTDDLSNEAFGKSVGTPADRGAGSAGSAGPE